jgi:hypothetical protein
VRTIDPATYPAVIAALLQDQRFPQLGPGAPNESVRSLLTELKFEATDLDAARACASGLWLYHDFLDESHAISQDLHEWYGSYWHGIMHRREPDPSNAKYWFRRVAANPVYEELARDAAELGVPVETGTWDAFAFVDRCEQVRGSSSEAELMCRKVQDREMRLLIDLCFRLAQGKK